LYHESQASCAGLVTQQFYKEFTKGSQHPKFTLWLQLKQKKYIRTETKEKNSFTIITHNTLVSQKKKNTLVSQKKKYIRADSRLAFGITNHPQLVRGRKDHMISFFSLHSRV